MTTLEIIDLSIITCIGYLCYLFTRQKYRLFIPSTIHTFTWLIVVVLIHFTLTGDLGKYNENGERGTYVTHNYKMSSSMDFEKMVKEYRKKIHKLEDQLAEENAKTIVELSEELEEHIFKLLEE